MRHRTWATVAVVLFAGSVTMAQPAVLPPVELSQVPAPPVLPPLPEVPGLAKSFSTSDVPALDITLPPQSPPPALVPAAPPPIFTPLPTPAGSPAVGPLVGQPQGTSPATPLPTGTPIASPAESDFTPRFKFKPGDDHLLQIESQNGLFKFFVGGRVQMDAVWVSAPDDVQIARDKGGLGDIKDAVNFRRARLAVGGTFYKNIEFLAEFDFVNTTNAERTGDTLAVNTPAPTDLYVTFRELPVIGNVRIGNQKPPVSFEHLTSSRFLNFMERSLAFDAFVENQNNGWEPGIMAFDTALGERMTWAVGVFKNTRSVFGWNTGDGEYDLTGRVTYLPLWENDGEYLVHLGLSGSHRDLDDDQERLRARLEVRNGPAVLHTIVTEVRAFGNSRTQLVPEFAAVAGPWTFQAEYYATWLTDATTPITPADAPRTNHGTAYFKGGYAEVLYFLTGEHRVYDRQRAAFWRVTPNNNYTGFGIGDPGDECEGCSGGGARGHGTGAWQVGLRYSFVDLDDNGIQGGKAQDVTLGLNWFLNPYLKIQWNCSLLHREGSVDSANGWITGFGTRIAFDF